MKFRIFALLSCLLFAIPAWAQLPGGGLNIGTSVITGGPPVVGDCLTIGTGNKLAQAACGGAPSGAAGGDLGGTYPNPTVVSVADVTTGVLLGANGGTGVANSGKTITLGGNFTTSGAFATTFTMTAATGVTFPTTGTLATVGGNLGVFTGTSLALGGAAIGTNALAVTGSGSISTTLAIGGSLVGGSVLTVNGQLNAGTIFAGGNGLIAPATTFIAWNGRTSMTAPVDGQVKAGPTAFTTGAILDFTTADTVAIKNFAGSGAGAITAGAGTFSGQLNVTAMTQTSAAQSGTVCYNSGTGAVTYDATLGCLTSSARFKTAIVGIDRGDALKMTMALVPVSFRKRLEYGGDVDTDLQVGFIAEQVADVDERLVSREPNGQVRGVRYQQTTAILAGAIQELKREIDEIKAGR